MTEIKRLRWAVWLLVFLVSWAEAPWLWADSPTAQVKATVDRVVEILRDSRLQGEARAKARRERLRLAIAPRFDFTEMAKRSLGSRWQRYAERQSEFVPAFTEFMERAYVGQIESYKKEKIVYLRERVDTKFAEVDTQVILSRGDEVPITYRLHRVGGDWKVYDVLIDHVSLVNNYRSQFHRILNSSSFDDLIRMLREKKI